MLHIIITVENDGKEIVEIERELDTDFFAGPTQSPVFVAYPKDADSLVTKAIDEAQDYLNSHPELWPEQTADDNDPQDD